MQPMLLKTGAMSKEVYQTPSVLLIVFSHPVVFACFAFPQGGTGQAGSGSAGGSGNAPPPADPPSYSLARAVTSAKGVWAPTFSSEHKVEAAARGSRFMEGEMGGCWSFC